MKFISAKEEVKLTDEKEVSTQAKSHDFMMVTSEIKSIDPALYLAEETTSSFAKVLFSGLGADEVFGGYARYKTAYVRGGTEELEAEMSLDLDRLWHRNFGRDDRVLSATGREARYPYLDLDLMRYMRDNVATKDLCDWEDHRGKGDKQILRNIAMQLGLHLAGSFEKRAIQFGSRIAKNMNVLRFGSNRKANGKAQFM